ncbi:MAG: hypothetical protein ACD_22C00172G0003 [uncultured bacterium]|uniref:RND efflux pump membrane fusion protein barrel-sandwich domain-containing protein n=1 Tax=candidate division WWE3 bacterium RBG_16_37_10 TaxID=1802610 RepID=A0A1F4V1F1_UNCKA|nr:MAG: hypothetical protein ACD_22C00172G0003 [uncultured bacterium]OGC51034.1 MAG: hypothetical protein A2W32_01755 [candidate division WWE3 bacterium RBG_16_37_10]
MNNFNKLNRKTILALILTILFVVGISGFYSYKFISKSTTPIQALSATVKKGDVTSSISLSGQVATANYLSVTTSVNGIVKEVFVKEGDQVYTGQNLMEITLDSEGEKSRISAYSAYLKAQNSLTSAKNSTNSLEVAELQAKKAFKDEKEQNSYQTAEERIAFKVAENDYMVSKNNISMKQAEIEQLELSLSNAWLDYLAQSPVVTAPTDGIIASVLAVKGSKIENSVTSDRSVQTVASIKKEGTPIASLNVGELDINNVKVGQRVNLTLTALEGQKFTGTVAGIDKIGSSQSGVPNYPVIVKFDKPSDRILPNMNVSAEIIVDQKNNVLLIPTGAIQTGRGKSMVKVKNGDGVEEVEVKTGISDSDNTEIISGLNEGDEVVINTLPTTGFTSGQSQTQFRGVGSFGGFGGR